MRYDVVPRPPGYRQSLLASFETCARRARFGLQTGDYATGYTEASAELGQAFHLVAEEMLRTLGRQGEKQMPTQEAVECMYEVMGRSTLVLPATEREDLKWLVLGFCRFEFPATRIIALEEPLQAEVAGPDGELRLLTGRPDLLMADPPAGIVIVDYKTGRSKPPSPRSQPADGETITGKQYLSDRGHFQLDVYGLLGLARYKSADHATLRELHLRSGEVREATIYREGLEHVERELGLQMQLMDRAISQGPKSELWAPRPGAHCVRKCPVARSCPIPREQRGEGAITSAYDADRRADAYAVADAQRQQLRAELKAYHEGTGHAPRCSDGKVLRWDPPTGRGRKFGFHDPLEEAA